jgi:phosphonate transport system substrate-binding protein
MYTRRELLISTIAGLSVAAMGTPRVSTNGWRRQVPILNFGVVSSENEADRIARYKTFVAYLERRLQAPSKRLRSAS